MKLNKNNIIGDNIVFIFLFVKYFLIFMKNELSIIENTVNILAQNESDKI